MGGGCTGQEVSKWPVGGGGVQVRRSLSWGGGGTLTGQEVSEWGGGTGQEVLEWGGGYRSGGL